MRERDQQIEKVFLAAIENKTLKEQQAFAREACRDDPDMLAQVLELLEANHLSEGPLDSPALAEAETCLIPPPTAPHEEQVGPYKLLQKLGEGGMGVVYLAEQKTPIKRRVALKIIKPGMDSRQVLARFDLERQALAMMDHPNIAKVFDVGETERGRPYFVMELVKGVPT
jgi:serine/threonine protein kinase